MAKFTLEDDNGNDTIDVRDIIDRVEELRSVYEDFIAEQEELINPVAMLDPSDYDDIEKKWAESEDTKDDASELATLEKFLHGISGRGDEEWEDDTYPTHVIRDSHFKAYAMEYAKDIGLVSRDMGWPLSCIDWEQAADDLRHDYTHAELGGITYLYSQY
jgi:antirestriction protein